MKLGRAPTTCATVPRCTATPARPTASDGPCATSGVLRSRPFQGPRHGPPDARAPAPGPASRDRRAHRRAGRSGPRATSATTRRGAPRGSSRCTSPTGMTRCPRSSSPSAAAGIPSDRLPRRPDRLLDGRGDHRRRPAGDGPAAYDRINPSVAALRGKVDFKLGRYAAAIGPPRARRRGRPRASAAWRQQAAIVPGGSVDCSIRPVAGPLDPPRPVPPASVIWVASSTCSRTRCRTAMPATRSGPSRSPVPNRRSDSTRSWSHVPGSPATRTTSATPTPTATPRGSATRRHGRHPL